MTDAAKKRSATKPRRRAPAPAEQPQPAKDRGRDSDDIERAVYDGMQDLRTKKPGTER